MGLVGHARHRGAIPSHSQLCACDAVNLLRWDHVNERKWLWSSWGRAEGTHNLPGRRMSLQVRSDPLSGVVGDHMRLTAVNAD